LVKGRIEFRGNKNETSDGESIRDPATFFLEPDLEETQKGGRLHALSIIRIDLDHPGPAGLGRRIDEKRGKDRGVGFGLSGSPGGEKYFETREEICILERKRSHLLGANYSRVREKDDIMKIGQEDWSSLCAGKMISR